MKINNANKLPVQPQPHQRRAKILKSNPPQSTDRFEAITQVSVSDATKPEPAKGGRIGGFLRSSHEMAKAVAGVMLSATMVLGGLGLMAWGFSTGLVPAVAGFTVGSILAKEGVNLFVRSADSANIKKTAP